MSGMVAPRQAMWSRADRMICGLSGSPVISAPSPASDMVWSVCRKQSCSGSKADITEPAWPAGHLEDVLAAGQGDSGAATPPAARSWYVSDRDHRLDPDVAVVGDRAAEQALADVGVQDQLHPLGDLVDGDEPLVGGPLAGQLGARGQVAAVGAHLPDADLRALALDLPVLQPDPVDVAGLGLGDLDPAAGGVVLGRSAAGRGRRRIDHLLAQAQLAGRARLVVVAVVDVGQRRGARPARTALGQHGQRRGRTDRRRWPGRRVPSARGQALAAPPVERRRCAGRRSRPPPRPVGHRHLEVGGRWRRPRRRCAPGSGR